MTASKWVTGVAGLLLVASDIMGRQTMAAEEPGRGGFPMAGEWGCYRRDGSQQGWSPLKGRIAQPKIAWKHFVSVVETLVEIRPDGKAGTVSTPMKDLNDPAPILNGQRWGLVPPAGMIEGREQPINRTPHVTYADILPDVPGLEKIEFETGFRESGADGKWPTSSAWLMAWKEGRWEKVWQMEPCNMLFIALPLVGDFDADGKTEIAFLPWYELLILDAMNGKVKDRCRFTNGRNYGFFGAYDMDGDGRKEFLVMSDFDKHMDVLGYRDGKLGVLWQMDIEHDISNPQKMMRVNIEPAADVDGDGKIEVMLNLQNGKGDGRWYVTVYDGMTGKVKADIADARLQSIADVNGDGSSELLTMTAADAMIPEYGTTSIWSLKDGKPSVIWEQKNAAWQLWNRPMPPHVNTTATDACRDALSRRTGNLSVLVTRRPVGGTPGVVTVSAESWRDGALRPLSAVTGADIEGVALDENGSLLVASRTTPGESLRLAISPGRGSALVSSEKGASMGPPAVVWDARFKKPVVVAGGYGEHIVAFQAPEGNLPARELWRVRGRPQTENWGSSAHRGTVMADLQGDGRRQLVYATAAPEGWGRLVVMGLDQKELWRYDIAAIPGGPPVQGIGGIILWQTGHFTDKTRSDVLITVRRSMMHSEETMLLSGVDGRQIWHRDRQILNRGVGGTLFAVADCDGDGLDDAVSLHPNVYYILKGVTGENILAHATLYWGLPVAGNFLNDGKTSIFFGTTRRAATGVLSVEDAEAKGVWWDAVNGSAHSLPAFGDFTGSGRMEAIGIGYSDGIRCYDTATGQVKWQIPMPAQGNVSDTTASGDVDSDGRDEALFVIGSTVYCIGADKEGKTGRVKWSLELPAAVGPPVIADADADGLAEILVAGSDGYVYCID